MLLKVWIRPTLCCMPLSLSWCLMQQLALILPAQLSGLWVPLTLSWTLQARQCLLRKVKISLSQDQNGLVSDHRIYHVRKSQFSITSELSPSFYLIYKYSRQAIYSKMPLIRKEKIFQEGWFSFANGLSFTVELLRKHCCFKRVGFKITKINKRQVTED